MTERLQRGFFRSVVADAQRGWQSAYERRSESGLPGWSDDAMPAEPPGLVAPTAPGSVAAGTPAPASSGGPASSALPSFAAGSEATPVFRWARGAASAAVPQAAPPTSIAATPASALPASALPASESLASALGGSPSLSPLPRAPTDQPRPAVESQLEGGTRHSRRISPEASASASAPSAPGVSASAPAAEPPAAFIGAHTEPTSLAVGPVLSAANASPLRLSASLPGAATSHDAMPARERRPAPDSSPSVDAAHILSSNEAARSAPELTRSQAAAGSPARTPSAVIEARPVGTGRTAPSRARLPASPANAQAAATSLRPTVAASGRSPLAGGTVTHPTRSQPAEPPVVQIGRIDIVVEAAAPAPPAPNRGDDATSRLGRFYVRGV